MRFSSRKLLLWRAAWQWIQDEAHATALLGLVLDSSLDKGYGEGLTTLHSQYKVREALFA